MANKQDTSSLWRQRAQS